jgi:hypothetical protein
VDGYVYKCKYYGGYCEKVCYNEFAGLMEILEKICNVLDCNIGDK